MIQCIQPAEEVLQAIFHDHERTREENYRKTVLKTPSTAGIAEH